MVIADSGLVSSALIVDVRMSRHGGTAGFQGHAELWTKNLAIGNLKQFDQYFYFSNNAPYLTTTEPIEQPIRGFVVVNWTIGRPPAANQVEVDSLDVWYHTSNVYDGLAYAWMYIRAPVVVSNVAGSISGYSALARGQPATWTARTHWDTTGYRFQWYVDGSVSTGDTAASFSNAFNTSGTYSLRVDQIRIDSTASSSFFDVKVYHADIGGPLEVKPSTTCSWYAEASEGTGPYTYRWIAAGTELGSGQYFDYWNSGYGFVLELIVTDATGAEVSVVRNISVSEAAGICAN